MKTKHTLPNFGLVVPAFLKAGPEWAMRFAQPLIRRNNVAALWYVGLLHHHGSGVTQDLAKARLFYKRSAAQGFQPALQGLRELDFTAGESVLSFYLAQYAPDQVAYSPKDCEAAFRELSALAAYDDTESQILLGLCSELGIHAEVNWDVALEWYRRAAVDGSEEGCEAFARLSTEFEGESGAWDRLETEVVCILAREGRQAGTEPTGTRRAIKWRLKAAREGDRYACWRLHELYLLGMAVAEDRAKSAKWLTRACEGHSHEIVRAYFESVRPRLAEVIDDHRVDVALRFDLRQSAKEAAVGARG